MDDSDKNKNKQNMIVSNILCYISTARHSLRVDDIVRACFVFYQPEDITKGKDLLCNLVGETSKRRRGENRINQELHDIVDLLGKTEDKNIELPAFVADTYNSLPPSSGFELVADHIVNLNEEISSLKKEIEALKDIRLNEDVLSKGNNILQEDLMFIKGELRKLNHKLMKDDLRRNSLLLSAVERQSLDDPCTYDNSTGVSPLIDVMPSESVIITETEKCNEEPLSPSAPDLSQEQILMNRLLFDEGGVPSAPSFSEVCRSQQNENRLESSRPTEVAVRRKESPNASTRNNSTLNTIAKDSRADKDGFILVNKKKQKKNVVGSRMSSGSLLRSASRMADLYVGNCDVDVTPESIIEYIYSETKIKVQKCEKLETKFDDYTSFKVTMLINDRTNLLSADVWPNGIVCRKYYKPRNTHSK